MRPRIHFPELVAGLAAGLVTLLAVAACAGGAAAAPADAGRSAASGDRPGRSGPYLRVLGTAQDGGFPHVACSHELCRRARSEPELARRVASLALVVPAAGEVYLVDATPDLPAQLEALADVRDLPPPPGRVDRAPVDGVFLTHAHVGHYLGLAFFGFESIHTRGLPVWATPALVAFLRQNAPWDQLVRLENVELRELAAGESVTVGGAPEAGAGGVTVSAVAAPHRDEYADTVGFVFAGPSRRVLYVPDTDSWDAWGDRLGPLLDSVDVAIVDATFYSGDELPGRDVASIGHPLVTDSLERFAERVRSGSLDVWFTHLNHSNPALDPDGPERRAIEARGFRVLADGDEIRL